MPTFLAAGLASFFFFFLHAGRGSPQLAFVQRFASPVGPFDRLSCSSRRIVSSVSVFRRRPYGSSSSVSSSSGMPAGERSVAAVAVPGYFFLFFFSDSATITLAVFCVVS